MSQVAGRHLLRRLVEVVHRSGDAARQPDAPRHRDQFDDQNTECQYRHHDTDVDRCRAEAAEEPGEDQRPCRAQHEEHADVVAGYRSNIHRQQPRELFIREPSRWRGDRATRFQPLLDAVAPDEAAAAAEIDAHAGVRARSRETSGWYDRDGDTPTGQPRPRLAIERLVGEHSCLESRSAGRDEEAAARFDHALETSVHPLGKRSNLARCRQCE